jgi:hypothetical protein
MEMTNYFRNHIALKGDPARLAAFKETHLNPHRIAVDWDNWGTKWDSDFGAVNPDSPDDILEFAFQTNGAPPLPALRELLQMWPDLTLIKYKGYADEDNHAIEYDLLTGIATVVDEEARNFEGDGPWTCEKVFDQTS